MLREAHATWQGGPYAGKGSVSTSSRVLSNVNYGLGSSRAEGAFTTPYELLAAAIASSMSKLVAQQMARFGIRPSEVDTQVTLMLEDFENPQRVTSANLVITARTSGNESTEFQAVVEAARRECPIWNAMKLDLTCEAKLISAMTPALV